MIPRRARWLAPLALTAIGAWVGIRRHLELPLLPACLRPARALPTGECTWYACVRAMDAGWDIRFDTPHGRHARLWWTKVTNAERSQVVVPGAVLVMDAWPGNEYGHVAYVESVRADGVFEITHANYAVGALCAQREGVAIYRARAQLRSGGVALEDRPPLPLVGFLTPRPVR